MPKNTKILKARKYGVNEICRKRSSEESVVVGKCGGVRLQTTVGEGDPSLCGYLESISMKK
jgi:hypothetical protein